MGEKQVAFAVRNDDGTVNVHVLQPQQMSYLRVKVVNRERTGPDKQLNQGTVHAG